MCAVTAVLMSASAARASVETVDAEAPLTVGRVVADAAPEVQAMMVIMAMGAGAAVAVWAASLANTDTTGLTRTMARLRIVRPGAPLLGLLTARYVLFAMFLGISNPA